MSVENIPAIFHPTTVLLIDDNPDYLLTVQSVLRKDTAVYKTFDNPKRALDFLKNDYQADPFTQRSILPVEDNSFGHHALDIDISIIRKEVYNPKRFDQISVMIVDQEMPGLKGLELCEALKNNPIKKLMLTGEVNDKQAIDAFNSGLIDHFINKADQNFSDKLNAAIKALQQEYFCDLSLTILDSIKHDPNQAMPSSLSDPLFLKFFNEFCSSHWVSEYYLCDAEGSFLLFNNQGVASCLVVQNKANINTSYSTADSADHPPTHDILTQLETGALLLYAHTQVQTQYAPNEWQAQGLLHKGKSIKGEMQTYYYAYIEKNNSFLPEQPIRSFSDYLEKRPQ